MLRARLSTGQFVLGIDAKTLKGMTSGQPITIDLKPMGGTDTVVFVYGETIQHIAKWLEKKTGQKLPPEKPLP